MSKAYLLVICLLAASFTGCLGSDVTEEEIPVEEEETIEPVGTDDSGDNETNYYNETNHYHYNNDTYYVNGTDYLELISQVENLTAEVEELTEVIADMQASKYDAPDNSSISIYYAKTRVDEETAHEYLEMNHHYEIIKSGNTLTIEYMGPKNSMYSGGAESNKFLTTPRNCTEDTFGLTVLTVDSNAIMSAAYDVKDYVERGYTVVAECTPNPDYYNGHDIWRYWTTITMTFAEEPVRLIFNGQHYTFE